MTERVLIVGAGLTGSMLGSMLKPVPGVAVEVWEKSRGAGGRAATARFGGGQAQADTGLQYLSTTPGPGGEVGAALEAVLAAGVAAPMACRLTGMNPKYLDPKQRHFVATEGASGYAHRTSRPHFLARLLHKALALG